MMPDETTRESRRQMPVRKTSLHDAEDEAYYATLSPAERVGMMWQSGA
jgi:hypothetical protein